MEPYDFVLADGPKQEVIRPGSEPSSVRSCQSRMRFQTFRQTGSLQMFGAGFVQSFINKRLNMALVLSANCGEFADDEISRSFEHPLFTEREGLAQGDISKVF